ncbi:MAG: glycosyltransferase [Mariprofundaceae bacterium]|nr:glycosyltransferase [Mariprofundaceae bacterium]
MKILHLITRMDGGGSAVNTLLTATHQAMEGYHVKLVYGLSHESEMSNIEKEKVVEGLEAFRKLGGYTEVLPSLKRKLGWHDKRAIHDLRIIILQGFDIVHTHTSKAGALGRLAVVTKAVKVIHTPHGHVFHGYFGWLKTRIFLMIERYLAQKTDILIALTKAERDDHLKLKVGRESQWRVVPSGVDVQAIEDWIWQHPVAKEQQCWDVISVGRLVPIKGMERLLKAWVLVVQKQPEAMLALVGDGEERRQLEWLAAHLGIADNVFFTGWVEPLAYLAKSKLFALLSHNEGMGRAVVEAMAAGLPCVVSDVCGLKELVDDTVGRCLDADDSEAVAKALMTDWGSETRRNARARAQAYSVQAMMHGLAEVYAEVSQKKTES